MGRPEAGTREQRAPFASRLRISHHYSDFFCTWICCLVHGSFPGNHMYPFDSGALLSRGRCEPPRLRAGHHANGPLNDGCFR